MDQQESEALAQFCADQHYAFDARAWQRRSQYDRNASTVAAMVRSEIAARQAGAGKPALKVVSESRNSA